MNERLFEILVSEALNQLGYDNDDYINIITKFNPNTFIDYANMFFVMGFEAGLNHQKKKHSNNLEKPVLMTKYKEGLIVKKFNSCREAAKHLNVSVNSIITALKKGQKCRGHYWEYAK